MVKRKFLKHPTEPLSVESDREVDDLVRGMSLLGFQGRRLGEVVDLWAKMLKSRSIVIWLGLAGAMVPAGMRRIVSYLIRRRMLDALVSTGANLYHDCYESLGGRHYLGSPLLDDLKLRRERVDRMYDVLADERRFYQLDNLIEREFCPRLQDDYPYSSREVLSLLGAFVKERAKSRDSILVSAYEAGVPIFSPALGDSSLGFSIMFANRRGERRIIINGLKDVDESSRITEKARRTGVVYVGGGSPKNFIQQTSVIASYQTRHDKSHSLAIQITTDMPVWGGLSGCTFGEAQSWGKIGRNAKTVTCNVDGTIALPIVSHALSQRFRRLRRNTPNFEWYASDLKINFQKARL